MLAIFQSGMGDSICLVGMLRSSLLRTRSASKGSILIPNVERVLRMSALWMFPLLSLSVVFSSMFASIVASR